MKLTEFLGVLNDYENLAWYGNGLSLVSEVSGLFFLMCVFISCIVKKVSSGNGYRQSLVLKSASCPSKTVYVHIAWLSCQTLDLVICHSTTESSQDLHAEIYGGAFFQMSTFRGQEDGSCTHIEHSKWRFGLPAVKWELIHDRSRGLKLAVQSRVTLTRYFSGFQLIQIYRWMIFNPRSERGAMQLAGLFLRISSTCTNHTRTSQI